MRKDLESARTRAWGEMRRRANSCARTHFCHAGTQFFPPSAGHRRSAPCRSGTRRRTVPPRNPVAAIVGADCAKPRARHVKSRSFDRSLVLSRIERCKAVGRMRLAGRQESWDVIHIVAFTIPRARPRRKR